MGQMWPQCLSLPLARANGAMTNVKLHFGVKGPPLQLHFLAAIQNGKVRSVDSMKRIDLYNCNEWKNIYKRETSQQLLSLHVSHVALVLTVLSCEWPTIKCHRCHDVQWLLHWTNCFVLLSTRHPFINCWSSNLTLQVLQVLLYL